MEVSKFLKRVRNLPLKTRKIILWTIVLISGSILFFFWVKNVRKTVEDFQSEQFFEEIRLPELQEELEKLPKLETEETIEELEESVKEE